MPQQLDLSQFTQPVLILGLNVYIATFVLRRVLEAFFKKLKGHYIWEDVILAVLPVGFGALLALIPSYPLPTLFSVNVWTKMAFGVPVGASSSLLYRIIKVVVKRSFGVDADGKSIPPPPPDPQPAQEKQS